MSEYDIVIAYHRKNKAAMGGTWSGLRKFRQVIVTLAMTDAGCEAEGAMYAKPLDHISWMVSLYYCKMLVNSSSPPVKKGGGEGGDNNGDEEQKKKEEKGEEKQHGGPAAKKVSAYDEARRVLREDVVMTGREPRTRMKYQVDIILRHELRAIVIRQEEEDELHEEDAKKRSGVDIVELVARGAYDAFLKAARDQSPNIMATIEDPETIKLMNKLLAVETRAAIT